MQILKEKIVRYETDGSIVKGYDAGELIRCKDCKHTYLMDNLGINGKWLMCKGHVGNTYRVSEDDFCSWAERKEE